MSFEYAVYKESSASDAVTHDPGTLAWLGLTLSKEAYVSYLPNIPNLPNLPNLSNASRSVFITDIMHVQTSFPAASDSLPVGMPSASPSDASGLGHSLWPHDDDTDAGKAIENGEASVSDLTSRTCKIQLVTCCAPATTNLEPPSPPSTESEWTTVGQNTKSRSRRKKR